MSKIPSSDSCSQGKSGCTDNQFGQITLYDGSTAILWIIGGCGEFLLILEIQVLYLCRLIFAGRKFLYCYKQGINVKRT